MLRMLKWSLILAAIGGGMYAVRSRMRSGYDADEIDSAEPGEFGQRPATAPEQQQSPAHTRTDVTPEQLSEAARLGVASERIVTRWPVISAQDVQGVDGDVDRLARLIATRTSEPQDDVRRRLDEIVAEETPRPSYPAQ